MKVRWVAEILVTPERTDYNISKSKERGLPEISEARRPPLAVVGGGPSVVEYIEEIRTYKDVWVSGSAFPLIHSLGIDATFFTIDQVPEMVKECQGAKKAILATCCDPIVFDYLKDADVQVFDLHHSGPNANHHATTVTAAPKIAIDMGYTDITFYGCDSSYRKTTHAYRAPFYEDHKDALRVECNGKSFLTNPGFLMQAEFMCQIIRMCPQVYKLRGDGLLAEMVINPDYDITHGAPYIAEQILKSQQIQEQA